MEAPTLFWSSRVQATFSLLVGEIKRWGCSDLQSQLVWSSVMIFRRCYLALEYWIGVSGAELCSDFFHRDFSQLSVSSLPLPIVCTFPFAIYPSYQDTPSFICKCSKCVQNNSAFLIQHIIAGPIRMYYPNNNRSTMLLNWDDVHRCIIINKQSISSTRCGKSIKIKSHYWRRM